MVAFEELYEREKPDRVIVVGDVNSTLACSVMANELLIEVAHVETGLSIRSSRELRCLLIGKFIKYQSQIFFDGN